MSIYRIRATGALVNEVQLREGYCGMLPVPLTPAAVHAAGADPVLRTPRPEAGPLHTVHAVGAVQDVRGNWVSAWELREKTQEQIAEQASLHAVQLEFTYAAVLEELYDRKAQERRYDNRLTCALRAGYSGPYQAEGQAFAMWMDTCNAIAYDVLRQMKAGTLTPPAVDELLGQLPELAWPD